MPVLDFDVKIRLAVTDEHDERLQDGEFAELEDTLRAALLTAGLPVSKLRIEDAGPHNVHFRDEEED